MLAMNALKVPHGQKPNNTDNKPSPAANKKDKDAKRKGQKCGKCNNGRFYTFPHHHHYGRHHPGGDDAYYALHPEKRPEKGQKESD